MKYKKSVLGPVISIFVMILVVAIISSITFLFTMSLKANAIQASTTQGTTVGEAGYLNTTGDTFSQASLLGFSSPSIIAAYNRTSGGLIASPNYTIINNKVYNATSTLWNNVSFNYTYNYVLNTNSYNAINQTENAGYTTVAYLPLIFLALIFGVLLTLVLKVILPYINLGQNVGQF